MAKKNVVKNLISQLAENVKEENKTLDQIISGIMKDVEIWIKENKKEVFDDYLKYNEIVSNKVDIIRNMDYKTLLDVVKMLDFTNKSVVIMKSNETTE